MESADAAECRVCRGRAGKAFAPLLGVSGTLYRCDSCGFCFTLPFSDEPEAEESYASAHTVRPAAIRKSRGLARDYWSKTAHYFSPPPRRVLEIGGSFGHFASRLKQSGMAVTMIDLNREAVAFARERLRIDAIQGSFFSFNDEEKFDVLFSAHVIEHLAHPEPFFSKCLSLLKPGGRLIVLTPNSSAGSSALCNPPGAGRVRIIFSF